ncbi:MAG: ribosomal protein S12 methylthiotransferase RimO [Nitrospinae bacterium RIFCSPLOWO2_02_FULL_39_110]|nr:MAG: ribosomal protein S12 methylthiotransferase RimO [Nitrospinae bacterium RIFCSPHIGHO2_02_39_11]OGW00711.1 MAG: ribosomal protein S12 methylthiotransferase RimO [Nitrospinae bacterium RIFCSPHIGHO2_12_FULL_39_42]OGW02032.1 MAG: ribosomal protein S12 methylthiotransferase RimO [Nitrospinae bacterium RIFCSPHIGHO2_02_FULL_39_82]OGW04515.1 MAG: ribosomal protein S12 methylthiotransferase RimO [Nitrospinae bacterium RIFCSPLOWO2_02_39_17]OGW06432.1 MAG: ribosomal protein S12 methylthiotransferas
MNRILRKIGMVSLGCPKNTVDSELVLGTLASKGYNITADAGGAEVIVVNTCGFIDSAKEESIDTILEMAEYKRKGSCQKLIVMGCLSQRYKDELLKEIPEVDYIVGTGDFKSVVKIIESDNGIEKVLVREPAFDYNEDTPRMLTTPRYTAYVKIAEGCSNRCSFCIIPKIRGPFKSRPADSIVREVEILSGHGVKEVNLISQDTTMYGVDLGIKNGLAGLLKRLVRIDGIKWIRLLYCYPAFLKDELINVIRDEEKICKYIDLPLQHSDDKILSKMMRQERGDKIRDLVNKIRKAIPDVAIRTVFIVGFPGEADTHFGHLVNFIKEMRFEHLGIFTYSPEEGTTAAEMSDQIPDEVKIERRDIIMKLQQKISSENNKRFVGMMRDVLVEDSVFDNEFLIKGRMQTQAPDIDGIVYIEEGDARVGDILPVKITRTMEYDFIGRAVNR